MTVVVVTRDRREQLMRTLDHLVQPAGPPVMVVDNGSTDGTAGAVRARHPGVAVVELIDNLGGAARNIGVALAATPYVAFSDDDSWWAPGALRTAADTLDRHPEVGLVAGRVLIGDGERLDPTSASMACSPLPRRPGDAGPSVLGFLACGAVVRVDAFLGAAGFDPQFGVGGEEELLALDLAAAGWQLVYQDDVVAHHHPEGRSSASAGHRDRIQAANGLRTAWLRLPWHLALRETLRVVRRASRSRAGRRGMADAAEQWREVATRRHVVPTEVARARRFL